MGKRILTKYRKKELEYFCLQYSDYKKELANIRYAKGTGEWDDPTYEEVIYRENLRKNIEAIDTAALVIPEGVRNYILKSVTIPGKSYDSLNPPCGRRQFYDYKDEYFIALSRKKQLL